MAMTHHYDSSLSDAIYVRTNIVWRRHSPQPAILGSSVGSGVVKRSAVFRGCDAHFCDGSAGAIVRGDGLLRLE